MKNIFSSLSENILERAEFKNDFQALFKSYIVRLIEDGGEDPERAIATRLTRSAQLFIASGDSSLIQIGIRIIDMFLEIEPTYLEDIIIIADDVFNKLGYFPNNSLLQSRWGNIVSFERALISDLSQEMHRMLNQIEKLDIDGTNFQVDLWNSLEEGMDIVTIAPTSTGKSFLIMQHVIHSITRDPDQISFAAFIVPSRALIHEVSSKIQKILTKSGIDNIEVATIGQKKRNYEQSTIFILTQERLLMLLHYQPLLSLSYVVIDEAQNISSESRGVLLHIAISKIIERGNLQLVFSSPSEDYKNTFSSLFSASPKILHVEDSPVAKNIIEVNCKGRELILKTDKPYAEVSIKKNFTGTSMENIVTRLGKNNGNIIYSNTLPQCETLVEKLCGIIDTDIDALKDSASYIRETVHDNYLLADAVGKGIGFHYGPLPRNIRIMIEKEVELGNISYLVCTSTLAEGVNLPAKNLFINDPKRRRTGEPSEAIPKVQYKNIIGRAGRLMTHFSGNIFLVNYDSWEFPQCTSNEVEPKLPTYIKLIQDSFDEVLSCIENDIITTNSDKQALITTVNKIIQDIDQGTFEDTMIHHINRDQIEKIHQAVDNLFNNIQIPSAIFELNPGISIIQQNSIYNFLSQQHDLSPYYPIHPQNADFYNYILKIVLLLIQHNIITNLRVEDERFIRKICTITVSWTRGEQIKQIIANSIRYSSSAGRTRTIEGQVRETVKIIDKEIRFSLVSAIKCFSQILVFCAEQKGEDTGDMIELYPYLELGASDEYAIKLMSCGLSRQTSLEIKSKLPKLDFEKNTIKNVINHSSYNKLHIITRREIESILS